MEPEYDVSEASFLAAVPQVRLDAFENYVRGIMAANAAERIRHLETATQLSPEFVPAQYQLGRAYFEAQQYEKASAELQRVPADHPLAMQAAFYLAMAQFSTGKYAQAEQTFSFIASRLPLPEVLNNQGVAMARQGKNATSLFEQAVTADPKDEDFHFNLALALWRAGDFRQATREVLAALALRPGDAEAGTLRAQVLALQRNNPEDQQGLLERLKRDFNESTIRQAAFALEQLELAKLGSQPADKRAAAEAADGDRYLAQGLLLEAEQSYQTALHTDSQNAAAHAGLANVRLKTGDLTAAKAEANASLKIAPSALAYVVLGTVQLNQFQLPAAASSASQALHLQPQDKAARHLQLMLQQRGVSVP
jgi:tetratricopeptide (TPR) repeat protein